MSIKGFQIDGAVQKYDYTALDNKPVADATLSVSGGFADAKVAGDKVAELKNALTRYNAYDIFAGKLTKTSGTSNGFTFTWSGDVCTVTGSATGYGANILRTPVALPSDVIPGNTYFVKYSTTDVNVMLRIIWRTSDNTDIRADYFTGDRAIAVPSTAEKWTISLFIMNTVTLSSAVTVSGIAMLNTRSNTELLSLINALPSDYFGARGVVTDGTDLNTVKQQGYYVLSSGLTYPNTPLSDGVAGILVVFPATANSIEQVVYAMGSPSVVKVYARSAILGNFSFAWKEVSGEQFVNEYVSEHYENTYNITCSPTISADTNNYLASTGNNTDRTGDIQTMLNATGVCHLGPGVFYTTGVEVPNYGALIGSGKKTQLILAASVTNGYAVKLKTYSTVRDIYILGATSAITPSSTVGTRHGILFEGTADAQSNPQTFYKSYVTGCLIRNFSGGGITCYNTGLSPSASLVVSDCQIAVCDAGINIPYFSEFHRITNVTAQECYYGCIDNGGNNNFANCDFSGNKMALLIDNSTNQSRNNTHGTFSACTFHHSDNTYSGGSIVSVGTAIRILGATAGEIFTGCQIGYGNLEIDDSIGIRFVGCNFLRMTALQITDSPLVAFSDCNFWNANSSPLTQSGNTTLKFSDCYLMNGTAFNPMA